MNDIQSHKDLKVWQESMILVEEIYKITSKFPKEELFDLTSQMKRAAVSVPSNIAEGSGRKGSAELMRFLYISLGSLSELDTQLEIAERLSFINKQEETVKRFYYIKKYVSKINSKFKRKKYSNLTI